MNCLSNVPRLEIRLVFLYCDFWVCMLQLNLAPLMRFPCTLVIYWISVWPKKIPRKISRQSINPNRIIQPFDNGLEGNSHNEAQAESQSVACHARKALLTGESEISKILPQCLLPKAIKMLHIMIKKGDQKKFSNTFMWKNRL